MANEIIEILKSNFPSHKNLDNARKELMKALGIMRSDEPSCPKCGNESLDTHGKWDDGTEYKCDDSKCGELFDWNHFN